MQHTDKVTPNSSINVSNHSETAAQPSRLSTLWIWLLIKLLLAGVAACVHWYIQKSAEVPIDRQRLIATLNETLQYIETTPTAPALAAVAEQSQPKLPRREALTRMLAGDISHIKDRLPQAVKRYETGEVSEQFIKDITAPLYGPYSQAIPALDDWVRKEPSSYAALLARGIVRSSLGWHWRGTDYIRYTPPENIQDMRHWHVLAAADLSAAVRHSPYPILAIRELIGLAQAQGLQDQARRLYIAGERLSPSSDALFSAYKPMLYAEWGRESLEAAKTFLKRAETNGVSLETLSELMRHLQNIARGDRYSIGEPKALAYAVKFSERYDTVDSWLWRARVERSLERYEEALQSLQRAADKTPESLDVLQDMAFILFRLKRENEANEISRQAAELGSDWAQEHIINNMISVREGQQRNWDLIRTECEKSAAMHNRSGQFCLGGLYFDGLAGYEKNDSKAIAWFELAARQGHPRAQHDYGWMLVQGMSVTKDRDKGVFYLRNSARKQFPPAIEKLKQLGERTDNLEWQTEWWQVAARLADRYLDRYRW